MKVSSVSHARRATLFSGSACALALAFMPTTSQAQDASGDDVGEEIVVTGIRGSIDSSVAQKKENTSIVEVVTAEDIGKLPDMSIAESLSRLPGLATQRLDGRANVVSIRGLAPDFTTTLLNGREQVSASNNRGVELDQYPSELLNGAVVYKTPDAQLIGQAIGGTIDMKSVRPLAYGKRAIAVGARFEINDLGKVNPDISDKGYRANISYIDQNSDGTVGWAIGYARMSSPTAEERWQAWGYADVNSTTKVIGGAKPYVKSNELARDGLMGVLEFKPDDKLHITLDGYWSQFKDNQRLRGMELPLWWGGMGETLSGTTVQDGLVTSGTYSNVKPVIRNDVVHRNSKIFAVGGNIKYKTNDTFTLELDASYSRLRKTEENIEIYAGSSRRGTAGLTDTMSFSVDPNGVVQFTPKVDYTNSAQFSLTDPRGWCGNPAVPTGTDTYGSGWRNCQDGFINAPRVKDQLASLRLQATQEFDGPFTSLVVGANYSDRKKQLIDEGYLLTLKGYPANTPIPSNLIYDPVSLGFIGIPGMFAFNSYQFYKDGNYVETPESNWTSSRKTNSFIVREKVLTGYVQANFEDDIGGAPIRGNMGVQVVHTDQQGDSFASTSYAGVVPFTDGAKYTEILPSLNMSVEAANNLFIRFGAARMLARARMDQLNPGGGINFNVAKNVTGATIINSPWSGSIGNGQLRPMMADTVDIALEKYFGRGAYVSVGGFYKYLENYIYRRDDPFDFSGVTPPTGVTPVINEGIVSQWVNGRAGRIYGAEFSMSLPFSTFSPALDGFGVIGSASYTQSRVRENGGYISMPGLSKWVANGTAYYEKYGFQARVSGRYRSSFLAEVSGLSLVRDKVMARSEFVVDAQIGYTFQSGSLEGLGILVTGSNLTNEPFTTYLNGDIRQVRDHQNYGRNFMVGISYKF